MKRTLIACEMMKDELQAVLDEVGQDLSVIWLDRSLHNDPDVLREHLQEQIDQLQDQDEILLSFGLCGNGTAGLKSPNVKLVLPKFDDCIHMVLCTGKRRTRGLTDGKSLYVTSGWILDRESILQQILDIYEQYADDEDDDEEDDTVSYILEGMFGHYENVTVIDTGCYDVGPVMEYAKDTAKKLKLNLNTVQGTNKIFRQLVMGEYDSNFIVVNPGENIEFSSFDIN